jgi:hypothetical protein
MISRHSLLTAVHFTIALPGNATRDIHITVPLAEKAPPSMGLDPSVIKVTLNRGLKLSLGFDCLETALASLHQQCNDTMYGAMRETDPGLNPGPDGLPYFGYVGRCLELARFLDASFVPSFCDMVVSKRRPLADLEIMDYDTDLRDSLVWILYVLQVPFPVIHW